MLRHRIRAGIVVFMALVVLAFHAGMTPGAERPNVVVFLADDLGYSDLGCYGGDIQTPNLDTLAKNGLRFTQFYNTARCWPTRAAILTGYYAQQVRRDTVPGVPSGTLGARPRWARLLSLVLRRSARSFASWDQSCSPLASAADNDLDLRIVAEL